ncbi:MAG TPA: vWA domain-containing protein, partial [Gammaproteobacteria bacterium]|nr:vWA domain-containing protein [Gammaproteobacteria bacterium]
SSRDALVETLDRVSASGGTPLKTSIQHAARALTDQGRRQLGYGEYHLVVITDGAHMPESEDPRGVVEDILGRTPIIIHTLGFCIGERHSLNQPGRIQYKSANNRHDLETGLSEVLAESPDFSLQQFE